MNTLNRPLQRIITGVALSLGTMFLGSMGYVLMGWNPIDALYMVVITMFGVGYGEVQPIDSMTLKVYTILLIFSGSFAVIYTASGIVSFITEGQLKAALGERRMSQGIRTQRNHVIICGFGRLGQILARELQKAGTPFVIIDNDEQRRENAEEHGYLVLVGNAIEEDTLRMVNIERAAVLATVLPSDADNVFITLTARTLNEDITIIARGEVATTESKLRQAGANHVILPATIGGTKMAELILKPESEDVLMKLGQAPTFSDELKQLGMRIFEFPIQPGSFVAGHTLTEMQAQGSASTLVIGVRTPDGKTHFKPKGERRIREGETIIFIGPEEGDLDMEEEKNARDSQA